MFNMKKDNSYNPEAGNVLFLILIAVALFAALSYAVTQSTRSGGGDASSETNLVNSAQITQYPASVRTSIIRMIVNGTDVTQLEFDPPSDFGGTSATRGVFHPSAGGATYVLAPPEVMASAAQGTWLFNSRYQITNLGTDNANNGSNEIIAFLPGVGTTICTRINTQLGIPVGTDADTDGVPDAGILVANIPAAAMNQDAANAGIGAYAATHVIGNDFVGQAFGCADFDATTDAADDSDLVYFHVLVER